MIVINENTSWYSIDGMLLADWLEAIGGEKPEGVAWLVDDDTELSEKIRSNPYFEPVTDADGGLIDITPIEPPPEPEQPETPDYKAFLDGLMGVNYDE